jgi:hypothetical protein
MNEQVQQVTCHLSYSTGALVGLVLGHSKQADSSLCMGQAAELGPVYKVSVPEGVGITQLALLRKQQAALALQLTLSNGHHAHCGSAEGISQLYALQGRQLYAPGALTKLQLAGGYELQVVRSPLGSSQQQPVLASLRVSCNAGGSGGPVGINSACWRPQGRHCTYLLCQADKYGSALATDSLLHPRWH